MTLESRVVAQIFVELGVGSRRRRGNDHAIADEAAQDDVAANAAGRVLRDGNLSPEPCVPIRLEAGDRDIVNVIAECGITLNPARANTMARITGDDVVVGFILADLANHDVRELRLGIEPGKTTEGIVVASAVDPEQSAAGDEVGDDVNRGLRRETCHRHDCVEMVDVLRQFPPAVPTVGEDSSDFPAGRGGRRDVAVLFAVLG